MASDTGVCLDGGSLRTQQVAGIAIEAIAGLIAVGGTSVIGDGDSLGLNVQSALHSKSLQDPGVVAALVLNSKRTPHLKLLQVTL